MLPRLLLATTNPHKIGEIVPILDGLPVTLFTLSEYSGVAPPDESGTTFADNARAKALYYANASSVLTVAEDSGLEIPLLGGAPGVYSARFNGDTYPEKFAALYERIAQLGAREPPARYVAAIALVEGTRVVFEASGTCEGTIAPIPRGTGGFGYDPILFYPPFARTMAELTPDEKAGVSHRGRVFRALREFLEGYLSTA